MDNKKILEIIKNECHVYVNSIDDMDGNRLRRGMTFNSPYKKMNDVGDGRNESIEDVEWEIKADEILHDMFGFHARLGSVYCSGGKKMAMRYGLPYSVFPIGNYEFIYSPIVKDLYYPFKQSGGDINAVTDAIQNGKYTNQNINLACDLMDHEIMVHCPHGYYAVRDDFLDDLIFHYRPF